VPKETTLLHRMTLSLTIGLGLIAPRLGAQGAGEAADARLRKDCRLATQILTKGQPDPHYDWARDIIGKCDSSGGPALAALWRSVPADSAELAHVVYTTSRLRDQRILTALLAVAQDQARPLAVRLATIQVLISYFKPSGYVPFDWLKRPPFGSPVGQVTEFLATEGSVPLGANTRNTILALMRQLAASDPDATMRGAARFVTEALEAEIRTGG